MDQKIEKKGIIYWFSANHVASNLLMILILIMGYQVWPTIKKEVFPELALDKIRVVVPYPNATPSEVEKGIIIPIEESIQDLSGIESIRSTASQGVGNIIIEIKSGYKLRNIMDDVKSRIDAIQNIPTEAEEPVIEEMIRRAQVISISVFSNIDEKNIRNIAERIRTRLLSYKGGKQAVTQAYLSGVRDFEISIEVSEKKLQKYKLTFDKLANLIRQYSIDLPAGSIKSDSGEILIRTENKKYTKSQFGEIPIITKNDGSIIYLNEIANIKDDFEEDLVETKFDGKSAILINVFRSGNEDTLKIADTTKKFINEVKDEFLRNGVRLEIWQDDSLYLSGRLKLLIKNGMFGLILVAIVLALFLKPSLALLVTLGIPVSFAGAILVMPYLGVSVNMISLFAFILVLGIVVDDAIVVAENVYRRIQFGEDPKLASFKGTKEVSTVVTFGILTTIVSFTPMIGLSGTSGKIWPNIPYIVIPTLLFSMLQSKLILPSHLSFLKAYNENSNKKKSFIIRIQEKFSRGLQVIIKKYYKPLLSVSIRYRYTVMSIFISLLFISLVIVRSGWVKFTFFPNVETSVINSRLKFPQGVSFEETKKAIKIIEEKAFELNSHFSTKNGDNIVLHVLSSIGSQLSSGGMNSSYSKSTNIGEVTVELTPSSNRAYKGIEIVSKWRKLVGDIPGSIELTFSTRSAAGGNAFDFEIRGNDIKQMREVTDLVKKELGEYSGVIDISDSDMEGKKEIKLGITKKGLALGLKLQDISRQVRQAFYGEQIQRLQRGTDEVKVFVRYPKNNRSLLSDLYNMKIRTSNGNEIDFTEVATAQFSRSKASITRVNQRKSIRVTADIDRSTKANATSIVKSLTMSDKNNNKSNISKRIDKFKKVVFGIENKKEESNKSENKKGILVKIKEMFPDIDYNFEGEQKDQKTSLQEMGQKGLIALIMMYMLIAIPLKSYIQPLIIMSIIPFGFVGAIGGHILFGLNFSIMSMCGIIALAGVLVNDSLLLVDYVNRHIKSANSIYEAVINSGLKRFRAIILTSLTTFFGLIPMVLETDVQARFLIPMAVSLSFGILFATFITLFLVPCIYIALDDIKRIFIKVLNIK